jgi:hypothetical protein
MAIVVLVLWLFTAGAGFYLLFTSNLSRARPAGPAAQPAPTAQPTPVTHPAAAATAANAATATAANAATGANASATAAPAVRTADGSPSRRATRRAARERWDPPSLVAARQAPVLPARSLVEFAHPTGGIIGLAFWLGFTLVHNRALGWIGFGLAAATACVGLGWFTANTRAARRANPARPAPSFVGRLAALHGSAAALTVALAAVAVLVLRA